MKKIYEKPMVELTKFDVEDIITASGGVDASKLVKGSAEADQAVVDIAATGSYDAVGVYNW